MICRLREISYLSKITASLRVIEKTEIDGKIKVLSEKVIEKMEICQLPVMVGSKLCYTFGTSKEERTHIGECQ